MNYELDKQKGIQVAPDPGIQTLSQLSWTELEFHSVGVGLASAEAARPRQRGRGPSCGGRLPGQDHLWALHSFITLKLIHIQQSTA